jgi:hypothetical protein
MGACCRWRFAAKWVEEEPELAAQVLEPGSGQQPDATAAAAAVASAAAAAAAAVAAAAATSGSGKGARPGKGARGSAAAAADPVLPYGCLPPAAELGLVSDLLRAGMAAEAAAGVAQQLAQASSDACAKLAKRRHQLASGKPPNCPELQAAFHRHSLDLTCGGRFVRVSRRALSARGAPRRRGLAWGAPRAS